MPVKTKPDVILDVDEACREYESEPELALDLETTGFSPFKAKIAVVALAGEKSGKVAALKVPPTGKLPKRLTHLLENCQRITTHNGAAFDYPFLYTHGVNVFKPAWFDTLISEAVISVSGRHDVSKSLAATLKRRLSVSVNKDIDHAGWSNPGPLSERQIEYVTGDITDLHNLRYAHLGKASETTDEDAIAVEMQLAPVVCRMYLNGFPIGLNKLFEYQASLGPRNKAAMAKLEEVIGSRINVNSNPQVLKAFNSLGFPMPNTKKETLQDLQEREDAVGEVARQILEARYTSKREDMYDDEWLAQYVYQNRIHSRYWQVGADTGRFTSSGPNMQQIPRDMRKVFGWVDGMVILNGDYAAIEARIAAAIAEDATFREVFESGQDTHSMVAAMAFGKAVSDITPDERKLAKAMSFTLLFGGGWKTFYEYARRSGSKISEQQAQKVVGMFFARFKGIYHMRNKAKALAAAKGSVTLTLPTGLRRILAGQNLVHTRILNTMVQGSAAAGIKYAMLEMDKAGLGQYLIAQVHDELVTCVPKDLAPEIQPIFERCMLAGMTKAVPDFPLAVDSGYADYWLN